MNSVNAVIKATELHVTVNFDIGRKCIFNLQFTTGSRRRVEEFYRKAIPRISLGLYIPEEERCMCLRKRAHCL